MQSICVFCGSYVGSRVQYSQITRRLGEELVRRNIQLVYGAGSIGLMGILADQVLELGGRVVGVIPNYLSNKEVMHSNLSQVHITDSLLERKYLMMELSDGFIALPGGIGTLDELLEVYSWAQLGRHTKAIGLLNACGYYDAFLAMIDHSIREGFTRTDYRRLLLVEEEAERLLDRMMES
ncbi:MAG: TIGR00730 family Rossman fold protein [Methylococcaceae bacterium]|nr:TIGR00730 family Rossman fold protein [Methylococcaceae bacterium]MCI0732920.1 TIGR00730 family Rossman fold protein [Methylococcaceae bacterium]